mmetsp:Transcript_13505/g.15371  ORF Transcript_13505/g.15371 Transcript_13505/m.15371 type:complete len:221 (-) Transcript_13505:455-1117(-)
MVENGQAKFLCLRCGDLHEEYVVVRGEGCLAIDRRHLVLCRCNFIVHDRHGDTKLEHFCLDVEEQLRDGTGHRGKVVEVSLLVARGQSAKQRPAAIDQIWPSQVVLSLDYEELLLPSEEGVDCLGVGANTNRLEQAQALLVHGIVGPQQGCFVINAGTQVRDKTCRDAEDFVHDKARRRSVPSREGCCSVCCAQPAIWEGGTISLAEEEALVWKCCVKGL